MVSPEKHATSNTVQTEHVTFIYLGIFTYIYITTIREKRGCEFESWQWWVHENVRNEEKKETMMQLCYNLQNNFKIMSVYICVYVCPRKQKRSLRLLNHLELDSHAVICLVWILKMSCLAKQYTLRHLSSDLLFCLLVCLLALVLFPCIILDIHI